MGHRLAPLLPLLALPLLLACGGGEPARAPHAEHGGDGQGHGHGHGNEGHGAKVIPPAGPIIRVGYDGQHVDVVTEELAHTGPSVSLADVWGKAFPKQDTQELVFDLVGSDGFHVGSDPACKRPLTGAELTSGGIDVKTHDVSFEPSLGIAHCYSVKSVVRIEATTKK